MLDAQIITAALGTVGAVWAAWLTYRQNQTKTLQDASVAEVTRLRQVLTERDEESAAAFTAILQLRAQILDLTLEVQALTAAAAALRAQVKDLGGKPAV